MHTHLKSLSRIFARYLGISMAVAGALLVASCSKPIPSNRYDGAMELAKDYSIQDVPKDFLARLGKPLAKSGYSFADLMWNRDFGGKFETTAEELDKQEYFQPDNRSLLEDIKTTLKLACDFTDPSPSQNVNCHGWGEEVSYGARRIRLLHTAAGDFIFSSANVDRGNGVETNTNASAVVIVIDPTDGGLGTIVEDHIAIAGGRHDVIAAAVTLASSIIRTENDNSPKPTVDELQDDLQAAKSKTLYEKPPYSAERRAWLRKLTPAQAQQMNEEIGEITSRILAGQRSGASAPTGQSADQGSSGPLTKDQFKNLVLGKTMAEVRSAIGEPSTVDSHADGVMWFYWSSKLPVQDPDSGVVFTSSSILFDPDTKIAMKVGF